MLRLDLPTEPRWVDLPLGVRVRVKPLTTALEIAADNVAARLVAERRAAQGTLLRAVQDGLLTAVAKRRREAREEDADG